MWVAAWSIIAGCSAFTHSAIFFPGLGTAFQGIGPALLLPSALAIAGRTYAPGLRKSVIFSLIAMCAPPGSVIGGMAESALTIYAIVLDYLNLRESDAYSSLLSPVPWFLKIETRPHPHPTGSHRCSASVG